MGSSYEVFRNDDDGSGYQIIYEDQNCTEFETTSANFSQTCMSESTSVCVIVTEAPTDAPTMATEAPTEGSTGAPTSGTSPITIFDFKAFCKVSEAKTEIEAAVSLAVSTGTGVDAECTISNCDATDDYDGAQFKYSCKVILTIPLLPKSVQSL